MTVEVVVMNRHAAALAADSTLTFAGPGLHKNFETSDKLFALTPRHPIGILVYGNAYFTGVPWETVIRAYATHLGGRTIALLEEYVDDFLSFLQGEARLFGEQQQLRAIQEDAAQALGGFFGQLADAINRNGASLSGRQINSEVRTAAESLRATIEAAAWASGCDEAYQAQVIEQYGDTLLEVIGSIWDNFVGGAPVVPTRPTVEALLYLVSAGYCREGHSLNPSGVVFAGFGEAEHFPACVELLLESRIGSRVKATREQCIHIDAEGTAAIVPLARDRAIRTFIAGLDPEYASALIGEVEDSLRTVAKRAIGAAKLSGSARREAARQARVAALKVTERFARRLEDFLTTEAINPFLQTLSSLPPSDLVQVAESLINLAVLREKVSPEAQTVGGPVDVAVVSRGAGFTWAKRKRQFTSTPADLLSS